MKSKVHITTELRDWLLAQAKAQFSPEQVVKAMLDSGWQEDDAIEAIETVLEDYLQGFANKQMGAPKSAMPEFKWTAGQVAEPLYLPSFAEDSAPMQNHDGEAKPYVISVLHKPPIVLLGGFLSDAECTALIEQARPRMERSQTVTPATGDSEINEDRTSKGMFFDRGESELIQSIEARIARVFEWPAENGEGLQVLQYHPGSEYKAHYDYFDIDAPGGKTLTSRGGQRVATLILYLHEPQAGGGTAFPDIGLSIAPKRGHALFFSYANPHPSSMSLHAGLPVVAGEKWIATKWLRERAFV